MNFFFFFTFTKKFYKVSLIHHNVTIKMTKLTFHFSKKKGKRNPEYSPPYDSLSFLIAGISIASFSSRRRRSLSPRRKLDDWCILFSSYKKLIVTGTVVLIDWCIMFSSYLQIGTRESHLWGYVLDLVKTGNFTRSRNLENFLLMFLRLLSHSNNSIQKKKKKVSNFWISFHCFRESFVQICEIVVMYLSKGFPFLESNFPQIRQSPWPYCFSPQGLYVKLNLMWSH